MYRQSDSITLAMAQANTPHPWEISLTDADASTIVNQYASLLTKTGASFDVVLADSLLADRFSSSHFTSPNHAMERFGRHLYLASEPRC
jgi:hypothetical protein